MASASEDNLGETGDNLGETGDNIGEARDNKGDAGDNVVEEKEQSKDHTDGATPGKFVLQYKKGDLFRCSETESLAHCVSEDLRMGKGIATRFKDKFGRLSELKDQAKPVGDVAVLKNGQRFVYYLITKPRYFNRPTYITLEQSLQAMKTHCVQNDVAGLSIPKIGCGLDKLEWSKVEKLIKDVFAATDITVTVYSL